MCINIKKTKVMVVTKKEVTPSAKITIEGRAIEQVKKFIYLGHLITDNGKCDGEVKRRIEIARGAHFAGQKRQNSVFLQGKLLDPGLPTERIFTI